MAKLALRGLLAALGIAALGALALQVLAPDQGTTSRHTLLYYLRMPALIRRAPMPGIVGEPSYVWQYGSAAEFPMASVMFRSALASDDAKREIVQYLYAQGFENHARGRLRRQGQYAYVTAENGFVSVGLLNDAGAGDTRSPEQRSAAQGRAPDGPTGVPVPPEP
jgi:hypothetical protein